MKLFEPFEIPAYKNQGPGLTLANRVLMGSMHVGLEDKPWRVKDLAAYFEARAEGEVGGIITGGYSPNFRGKLTPWAAQFRYGWHKHIHKKITEVVHHYPTKIFLQLLHAGRYAYHPFSVSASALKSPINPYTPKALSKRQIRSTIKHFIDSSCLAEDAGYDGVEIMGSEGYFLHQFWSEKTNQRTDEFGGSVPNRMRLAIEIIEGIRARVSPKFVIFFRIPILDLVEPATPWDETVRLAKTLLHAGVSVLNSGIGWHESRVPTIASSVPTGAFLDFVEKLKRDSGGIVVATNRIYEPKLAEQIVVKGQADLVSMARPFLADPEWVKKVRNSVLPPISDAQVNVCIACNQACLDHIFEGKQAGCLVNPEAVREREVRALREKSQGKPRRRFLVAGAGVAGLSFALEASLRGHQVTLLEQQSEIGGQFKLAARIPGKEVFQETLKYYLGALNNRGVKIHAATSLEQFGKISQNQAWDALVLATGVVPREYPDAWMSKPPQGIQVVRYNELLRRDGVAPGRRIAVLGGGGIGVDVSDFLTEEHQSFFEKWGIDASLSKGSQSELGFKKSDRMVYLLQRSKGKLAGKLGKTTQWIHRIELPARGVRFMPGCVPIAYSENGLWVESAKGKENLEIDQLVLCIGQCSNIPSIPELFAGIPNFTIGGAKFAGELDAKRAILEGHSLVDHLEKVIK